jgi:chaperonin GroEL
MNPKDRIKEVTFGDVAHTAIRKGVDIMQNAVGSTYGPGGRNVIIQKQYVTPVQTRDGVTVARDIAGYGNKIKDPIANAAAQLLWQASDKTAKTAGDGTTATVMLAAELYKSGYRQTIAGNDAMIVKRQLDADRDTVEAYVQKLSKEVKTKAKLRQVAEVSSGNKALGEMISDLVWEVGSEGTININYHNPPHIEIEKVTGYLFNQGFRHLAQDLTLDTPLVLVTQKRLESKSDVIPILEAVAASQQQLIIVGDVAGAAMDTIVWALANQKANIIPIQPPAFGADGHEYFVDISTYVGGRLYLESDSFKDFSLKHCGVVRKAILSQQKATLFGDNQTAEAIVDRMAEIKKQLTDTQATPSLVETLEQRYAKLAGKVSIIKVGAATEVEREELFFRVEDAVEACKSALSSGIVAGGATTLLWASTEKSLQPFVREALQQPFRILMSNAAEDGGYRLQQVLAGGYGKGFNLRKMTENPIDLHEAGIVDATKVVLQTVRNGFSVAGALLTTGTVITEVEHEVEQPVQAQ